VKARFAELEATPLVFTPKQYGEFLVSESERWGKAVKAAGVRGIRSSMHPARVLLLGFALRDLCARVLRPTIRPARCGLDRRLSGRRSDRHRGAHHGAVLSDRLGQQVIVENRPGAGSNVATQAVIAAPPDGYTLMIISPPHAINATLYRKLPYNFLNDIALVAGIANGPNVMEVHPSVPARTVAEFIAYAKANPGKISYASAGNGTDHPSIGRAVHGDDRIKMQHVPYRGSAPALTDMISGQVHVMFDNLLSSMPHLQSGALRPLAVTSAARAETLPDVPTVADTVPATRPAPGGAWARRRQRPPTSSTSSIARTMRVSPSRKSRRALPSSAPRR
jgi:tripartite-type tricarboxylate transporter receptor subunit TctC